MRKILRQIFLEIKVDSHLGYKEPMEKMIIVE